MIQFDVLTLFPELFTPFLETGLMARAQAEQKVGISLHNLRQFSLGERPMIDDRPFGGGDGVIFSPEPIAKAIESVPTHGRPRIFLTPQGKPFSSDIAKDLISKKGAVLLCGRYGGIDERIREGWIDLEISIGDYVLMGGELPAMVVMEAAARFIPGVLGNEDSAENDSFQQGLLEGPQYTRPRIFQGKPVPEVLLSGNHVEIKRWRERAS